MAKYEIKDLEEFTENARRLVFSGFGKAVEETQDDFTDMVAQLSGEEETEMNQVLSQQESILIVESLTRKQTNKTTKEIRYIVNEKMFTDILEALNARLVSNILSNLNKRGLIESAYDDDLNDFVFWVKEDDNKINQKPKTN
jgi:regulator of PEP synthase PpsR (kinase-PPPase family)